MQWITKPCRTFCPLPKSSITITPIHVIRKYLPLLPYADFTDFPLWTQLVFVLSEFVGSSSLLQKVIPPVFPGCCSNRSRRSDLLGNTCLLPPVPPGARLSGFVYPWQTLAPLMENPP